MASENVIEGIRNLVVNCAEVGSGEKVLILNEYGKVDTEIAELIRDAVKASGASYYEMWGEALPRGGKNLPEVLVAAILAADKVIFNYDINRVVLDEYVAGKGIIQINNGCRTAELMGSEHARYDWGEVRRVCAGLEAICSGAKIWRITSPADTEISGEVCSESEVAGAFFAQDAAASRFIRVIPGEVYAPVGSMKAHGKVVVEYINIVDTVPWEEPAVITIENDRVVAVEGGDRAQQLERELLVAAQGSGENARVLDSWHGGMNPAARVPTAQNPTLRGATSSPALMHFHLGRLKRPISAGILNHRVEIDGRKIFEDGRLVILGELLASTSAG